jgi:hypothetical protein
MFINVKWTEVKENQQLDLNIKLGNESPWQLTATALALPHSSLKPLTGIFDKQFIYEMASQPTINISQGDRLIATLDLRPCSPSWHVNKHRTTIRPKALRGAE